MSVLDAVGRWLLDSLGMLWLTWWALVIGFTLSGAVQAFVSRAAMQRSLGDHRPAALARASGFGAASSSCSYAAAALAKTLFVRGADFTSAQVFLVASTNLVLELGIVLWLLVGWPFAVAEPVGGIVMITVVSVLLPRLVGTGPASAARVALGERSPGGLAAGESASQQGSWRSRLTSRAGWSDAASFTLSDLAMLRRELVIGFLAAGAIDSLVPLGVFSRLLLTGHGVSAAVENAVIGPLLAMVSFVCSMGNVPLAASLWSGGATFAGVVAFIFGDLLTLPLLAIYRGYYGTKVTLRLVATLWTAMSLAGLATEYLFRLIGIAPSAPVGHHGDVGRQVGHPVLTTALDVAATLLLVTLVWLARHRDRLGGGHGYATDPVCGMQVSVEHAPATMPGEAGTLYFCSDGCQQRYRAA